MYKKVHAQSKSSFVIAPGQSKIPTSLMSEKHWDINAFPCLHPTGRFGLNYHRDRHVSIQQYVKQRLLNCDDRFVSHPPIVFAYLYLIEKLQLEQRISLSYVKGKVSRISDMW